MSTRFAVDADLLTEVTARMSACEATLEQLNAMAQAARSAQGG